MLDVLIVSHHEKPFVSSDGHLHVIRPGGALYGARFDLIVDLTRMGEYSHWWKQQVLCRLTPNGRIIRQEGVYERE